MVFLTMLPQEFEHTKEPAYDKDVCWLPGLRLQPFSGLTPSTKESKPVDDYCGKSGGDMADVVSSSDICPLPENELSQKRSEAVGSASSAIIKPAFLLEKLPRAEEQISNTVHASSTESMPPANAKQPAFLETSAKPLPSEESMTENKIPFSAKHFRSKGRSLLGEFRASQSNSFPAHRVPALTSLRPLLEERPAATSRAGSINSSETIENLQESSSTVICSKIEGPIISSDTLIKVEDSDTIFNCNSVDPRASCETVKNLGYSDAIVRSNIVDLEAAEKPEPKKGLKVSTKSHLHENHPTYAIRDDDRQESVDCRARTVAPSTAISCPTTFSATDAPSTRLRHMVANSSSIILCPGVYDGLSARIALHVGFQGMYMTGAGTTASCLGASDLGIAHLHDMQTNAAMIANLQPDGPPLIADMDTGYGGPLIISRAVKQYARAGVAAFHIEDQVPEKRCGHLSGKEVVEVDSYLRRIRACLDARAQIRSDIVIIARTDALQSRGYEECVSRLRRARDLGADMGILEGVSSKEMAAQAVKDLAPWPLCYNSVENGHSPLITAAEAQAMGYRLMIFSFAGIAPAYMAIMETFTRLKEQGVTGSIVGPKKIFEVCGLEEEMRIDEAAGGSAFAKGL